MIEQPRTHLNVFPGKICEPEYLPEKDCYRLNNPDGYNYRIGCYELFDYIGEGGSCLVYKALDTTDGSIVMIKEYYPASLSRFITREGNNLVLRPGVSDADRTRVERAFAEAFRQELSGGAEVRYTEDLNNDDRFLIATNLVCREGTADSLNRYAVINTGAGITLDELCLTTAVRARIKEILTVMLQLCTTVDAFHKKGRIHLDLNERNIFLRGTKEEELRNRRVSLIDFGSSFAVDHVEEGSSVSGSDRTAAPEQKAVAFGGKSDSIGKHSDVYSMTQILKSLLARDAEAGLFPGFDEEETEASFEDSRCLKALSEPEREELFRILEKGTEQNPAYRYQSVEELADDLRCFLDIVEDKGVHPVIIKKRARERGQILGAGIRPELVCEVSVLKD